MREQGYMGPLCVRLIQFYCSGKKDNGLVKDCSTCSGTDINQDGYNM